MLFDKDNIYATYMLSCDEEQMGHMYTLVDDIKGLDGFEGAEKVKTQLRNKILEKYPDYKFHATEEKSSAPKGMLVTAKKLEEKRALVEKMQNVDIPAIAKEAQHKLGNDLKRLQEELARAVVFDPTTATSSLVSFGTKVTLLDKNSGNEEEYTILGPWESNPESGVISYMSPFGNAILDHKVGEELSFTINEHKYNFEVKKIIIAKL